MEERNKPAIHDMAATDKLNIIPTLGTLLPVPPILLAYNIKIHIVSVPHLFACITVVPWSLTLITKRF